ncbi:c-type cytochrome biogenesis protein CcmI [Pseudoroseomonas rhizosphaerae]|uniref:C-type cytochrome biogenesis protein CcmI n=1 Tax=Teichococcus rhizosphaerae TaxID=1335062 RepID=A0A2C7A9L1_9PROT|nr:c-type cytochrome biogenesis protein CcmI [Pseudoroseomonas rhizosphaerae]PHK95080.1 c-type cytochrome biogenesis protein CcmI [Pseudoroseomonas rhizosphaerae]
MTPPDDLVSVLIWLLFLGLAALALAPLGLALLRPVRLTGRREADLALYRAQLAELERERAAGRLDEGAHRAATLEVQRRLLASSDAGGQSHGGRGAAVLAALLFLVPALGFGVYLQRGNPELPAAPYVERAEAAARDDALMTQLRARLEQVPAGSETARQGWILLGNAERGRGRWEAAAAAWRRALEARFEGPLAAELAELLIEHGGLDEAASLLARALAAEPEQPRLRYLSGLGEARAGRTENARATWRALLAQAPADAPWRALVERRLQELP